jgi:hypothetical protein
LIRAIIIAFAIAITISCILVIGLFKLGQWISLQAYRQQISQWDVPPDTTLKSIDFKVMAIGAGNECDAQVILTLQSVLTADEIYEFYMDSPQVNWLKEPYLYVSGMTVRMGDKPDEFILEAIKFMNLPCLI